MNLKQSSQLSTFTKDYIPTFIKILEFREIIHAKSIIIYNW